LTLLDANTLIHYLRGHPAVVARLQSAPPRQIAIPSIVTYEIEYGTLKIGASRRREIVSRLLASIQHVPFDDEAALESARIRVDLEARGLLIGPMDLLIAGTAVSRGAVLVTNNTKEFSRIKGLRLSDWTK
jgi:tRNA(fMet)-specific endonuclease VapC